MGGAIFETAVVSDVVKRLAQRGTEPRIYFWRTATRVEVDLLVEAADRLIPIHVSSRQRRARRWPGPSMLFGMTSETEWDAGSWYPGDVTLPLAPNVTAIRFAGL